MAEAKEIKIITLDTETIGLDGALKRIAIYDGLEVTYGYKYKDILPRLDWYYEMGYDVHVYIHNMDFDLRKLPEVFEGGNVLWNKTKKIGNRYARLVCKKYTMHDSFKILPSSLEKLSRDFELTHGKLDLWEEVQKTYPNQYTDKVDFLNRCDPDDKVYLEYLGYDVISLYELIYKMIEISKLSEEDFVKVMSTASLSRMLFKEGYNGKQFQFDGRNKTDFELLTSCKAWSSEKNMKHTEISYLECEYLIRLAFYGGRTEVFTPFIEAAADKEIQAFHYDVNSLYPVSMKDNEFPISFPEFYDDERFCRIEWENWLEYKNGLGFIRADVFIPPQDIPPLPCKMGKLAFVTGYVTGSWTYIELEYAVKHCGVKVLKIHHLIHFQRTHKVFHNFVTTFNEIKEQATRDGNESLRTFAKLILNTSYGWTVLRRDDKTTLRDISKLEQWQEKREIISVNEELGYFEMPDKVMTPTVQVQVGAYVTSYARLILLDALRKQAEKGVVYYCDTDSIVCSAPMSAEDVDPVTLGKWGLESELYSGIFLQPKVYTEHKLERAKNKESQTVKFKGITKARQSELDEKFYRGILRMLQEGSHEKLIVEHGRQTLPTLSVAQKQGIDPNQFKTIDKGMNLGAMQKRDIDYKNNKSRAWHMESLEMFNSFDFKEFKNAPDGKNLFGGEI